MVDPLDFVGIDLDGDGLFGSGGGIQVLEGVGTVAEGEEREQGAGEGDSGTEDERGELRPVQGPSRGREEDEELQRRNQMETHHRVFSESDHHRSCFLFRSPLPRSQAHSLQLVIPDSRREQKKVVAAASIAAFRKSREEEEINYGRPIDLINIKKKRKRVCGVSTMIII